MTTFKRMLNIETGAQKDSEALAAADQKMGHGDLGKLFKLGANSFELCADGDQIDGQLDSLREFTVNDGYPFGTVKKGRFIAATVKTRNTAVVGKRVVAEAQAALGDTSGVSDPSIKALVKIDSASPSLSKWRIYSIVGNAAADNCKVILERN